MKKTIINFFLLATVAPFLVQCASQADVEDLRYQLRIVNKKLEDLKGTTVGQLQKRQAAAFGQVDQVEQDILELRSQLEETYHLNQRLREQNKELEATITSVAQTEASKREEALRQFEATQREKEQRLTEELNKKLQRQQETVKAIQKARIKEAERRAKEAALAAQLAKTRSKSASSVIGSKGPVKHIRLGKEKIKMSVVSKPKPPAAKGSKQPTQKKKQNVTGAVSPGSPNSTDFSRGEKLYQNKKYKEALLLFEKIAADSSTDSGVDALFMVGECLYQQKEYDKAIMQYQTIISQHGGHAKSPEAMLKQGMAFEKLADKDTAKVIYKKLLKKHSSSAQAQAAEKRLGNL